MAEYGPEVMMAQQAFDTILNVDVTTLVLSSLDGPTTQIETMRKELSQ